MHTTSMIAKDVAVEAGLPTGTMATVDLRDQDPSLNKWDAREAAATQLTSVLLNEEVASRDAE